MAGLLEGAHAGVGLGHEFLRHTQRCKVLVHVIDGTSPDPIGDYNAIRTELELFNPALIEKPEVRASPVTTPLIPVSASCSGTLHPTGGGIVHA